ncbi:armadillo-type protein [Lactarius hatsudake]|nr:armadillo-type protein [Lactarius hatsudake]
MSWDTLTGNQEECFRTLYSLLVCTLRSVCAVVYLFLIHYGQAKADSIHMVIPNFLQDCNDRNLLAPALAIRTMSQYTHLRRPRQLDRTALPSSQISRSVRAQDGSNMRRQALCRRSMQSERGGFVELLRDILVNSNATVVANAVAALSKIADRPDGVVFKLNLAVANKLITALGESSEYGIQLSGIQPSAYWRRRTPTPELIGERISVQLQHSNSAVVLTTIKVLLYLMKYMDNKTLIEHICKKMGPPLETSNRPQNDVKVFFCKYNDPIYVKLAKLETMYRLANEENVKKVLAEPEEKVDIDFVRKAVRSIGRSTIKVSYVVQEAIIVTEDILQRYPGRYERIISKLCEILDAFDEPEAKVSKVWIIGQFANRINNADDLLDDLTYNFLEEPVEVQFAHVTAAVKLFLYKSSSEKPIAESCSIMSGPAVRLAPRKESCSARLPKGIMM